MYEEQEQRIASFRKNRTATTYLFAILKLVIAYGLITYIDFGLFIVIGYIFYALESASAIQFINSQETNLQLNVLNQRLSEIESRVEQ